MSLIQHLNTEELKELLNDEGSSKLEEMIKEMQQVSDLSELLSRLLLAICQVLV